MTAFTRLGSTIWDWEPWTELDERARILWLALYTSAEARRNVVGLWHGGIPTMADASRMQPDNVRSALDALLERELVEFDAKSRVLRLCALPDPGEYPHNGNVILSWWTRFKSVPECAVRDSHVRTLQWIMEEGAKKSKRSKENTAHHVEAWQKTFGTIVVPLSRRRGVRRLADNDTSTHSQPSLFGEPATNMPAGNGSPYGFEYPGGSSPSSGYPQDVDNSASLRQLNKIRAPETVSDTVGGTVGIRDPGSGILDPSFHSGEGGWGGGHDSGTTPALSLVPPYTAGDVLVVMAKGPWDGQFDESLQNALGAMIQVWVRQRVSLDDFVVLADYSAHSRLTRSSRWLLGCDLMTEIRVARQSLDWRDARARAMAESL